MRRFLIIYLVVFVVLTGTVYAGQLRPPPVKKLSQLTELIRQDSPVADSTKALLRLGQPLIGGSASGTLIGGRQINGEAWDLVNWQGTDGSGNAKNRFRVTPQGAFTLGDSDCTSSSITLLGNNTGNNVCQFGISGGVPFLTLYDAGGGTTKTIGRTDISGTPYSSFTMSANGSGGWLFRGRGGGILRLQDASGVDRDFIDDTGHMAIGAFAIDSSAALQVVSTTRGFLGPVMTTTQRNAMTPTEGVEVYDLTLHKKFCYDGTTWQALW
jgi:hypothetical protein